VGRRQPHTADDLELGPVPATWSMEVFYELDPTKHDRVGTVSPTGFFTPAAANPGSNYDVWIIATAKKETRQDGTPLVGKGYLVVTVPTYTFEGRTFVRELGRWIEEGSSAR
jgi:quinohemoprotein amine dehydrogenase